MLSLKWNLFSQGKMGDKLKSINLAKNISISSTAKYQNIVLVVKIVFLHYILIYIKNEIRTKGQCDCISGCTSLWFLEM